MSVYSVLEKWLESGNIPHQFLDQPKLLILIKALAQEMQEVTIVFEDLNTKRHFDTAEGAQLDGLGNIVVLERNDVLKYYQGTSTEIYTDEYYKLFLKYKNIMNNASGTYRDIIKALKEIFNPQQIYYSQTPSAPATLSITISGEFTPAQEDLLLNALVIPVASGISIQLAYTGSLFFGFGDINPNSVGFGRGPFAHSIL